MSDPALIRDPILEAAARALMHSQYPGSPYLVEEHIAWYRTADKLDHRGSHIGQTFEAASAVLAAVTPLILERAAKVAEDYDVKRIDGYIARDNVATAIAEAIRALKEQPVVKWYPAP